MNYHMESDKTPVQEKTEKYLKSLKTGSLLLATEKLPDINFNNSLILLCMYEESGAFGLICNRTSNMPLREIFSGNHDILSRNRTVHIGGPVNQDALNIVQLAESGKNKALKVSPGIFIGGEWESVESIVASDPESTKFFLGYSGWTKGQLEYEITAGAWEVYNASPEKILQNTGRYAGKKSCEIRKYLNRK